MEGELNEQGYILLGSRYRENITTEGNLIIVSSTIVCQLFLFTFFIFFLKSSLAILYKKKVVNRDVERNVGLLCFLRILSSDLVSLFGPLHFTS